MIISQYTKESHNRELDEQIKEIANNKANRIINEYLAELMGVRNRLVTFQSSYLSILRDAGDGAMYYHLKKRIDELTRIIDKMEKEVKE